MSETKRVRAGGEKRGNASDRRARKLWMLRTWGNGVTCPCVHCNSVLSYETVEADRIIPGASYRRENVQPACRSCNLDRSNKVEWAFAS
jgi:5-methylcytosine-specific restriction endonuclease McrA